jgi:NTP pyrophosphatase (non-canonical NTP hydrolase)
MELKYESKDVHQALAHLVEEAGEVLQAAGKSQRFGLLSTDPTAGNSELNVDWLIRELNDLEVSIAIFKAFVKASTNDDLSKWSHPIEK